MARSSVVKKGLAEPGRRPLAPRQEVADYLGVPPSTLAYWAMKQTGPRFVKVGRSARYDWDEVEKWLAAQEHSGGNEVA